MTEATDGEAANLQMRAWSPALTHLGMPDAITGPAAASGVRIHSAVRLRTDASQHPILPAPTHRRALALRIKRVLDVVLALLGLIILSPVLAGAAIVIAVTTPGPVLLHQRRCGLYGKQFGMLKFRTMYIDRADHSGKAQTRADDDRVTPIGRFLRRTSIDELPQLINVIAGEMSLVGPRPHVEGMLAAGVDYAELVPYYNLRHVMRPGLSGWAQANGLRGPTDSAEAARARIDHDVAYIQNFSIWLDLKVIWLTLMKEFVTGSGV